jgi:hypothetical protein
MCDVGLVYSPLMDKREIQRQGYAFDSFKQAALHSLLLGCFGAFLLGLPVGLAIAP